MRRMPRGSYQRIDLMLALQGEPSPPLPRRRKHALKPELIDVRTAHTFVMPVAGLKPPVRRGMSFKFQKTRVQSDEERQARLQAKQVPRRPATSVRPASAAARSSVSMLSLPILMPGGLGCRRLLPAALCVSAAARALPQLPTVLRNERCDQESHHDLTRPPSETRRCTAWLLYYATSATYASTKAESDNSLAF